MPPSAASPLTIILPVRNEATLIEGALAGLAPLRVLGAEVIVADGGSSDGTRERAAGLADQVVQAPPGRARQMNAGAAVAAGQWLLFLHVDTRLPRDAPQWCAALPRSARDWGFFPVRLSGSGAALRVVERSMNLRSRLSRVATGDQCLFLRRSLFRTLGGFPELPLMEDVAMSKLLRRTGAPTIWPSPVCTSSRRWEDQGVLRTVMLMWWLRLAYLLGVPPVRLHRWYYGRQAR